MTPAELSKPLYEEGRIDGYKGVPPGFNKNQSYLDGHQKGTEDRKMVEAFVIAVDRL